MRGKDIDFERSTHFHRITPAYAGKSLHSMMRLSGSGDHPRLCGEKNGDTEFDCSIPGSPPPMRGKAKNF